MSDLSQSVRLGTSIQPFVSRGRRHALLRSRELPEQEPGSCLFADISSFPPLTESLGLTLGPQQGAESLTYVINEILEALIAQVHRYGGDVIGLRRAQIP